MCLFAHKLFMLAFDCCSGFTLANGSRFFIAFTAANFRQNACFFTGALEATQGDLEGLVFSDAYRWHKYPFPLLMVHLCR